MPDEATRQRQLEEILRTCGHTLRVIARSVAEPGEAADVEQEIVIALWKSLEHYEGRASLTTWFHRVAVNASISHRRTKGRRIRESEMEQAREPATCDTGHNRSWQSILAEFVGSLGPVDRMVFLMQLDGLPCKETAGAAGISEAALRMRVSRLKAQFEARYLGR